MEKEHIAYSNQVVTFRISENLLKKLQANAKIEKTTRSKLIISLLEKHLNPITSF